MVNVNLQSLNHTYYIHILKILLGHINKAKQAKGVEELLEILEEQAEKSIKEEARSAILPTAISTQKGKNFHLRGKKLVLTENEVNEFISDLAGVYVPIPKGAVILNIKNSKLFEKFRDELIRQDASSKTSGGTDLLKLFNAVGKNFKKEISTLGAEYTNIPAFLLLNYFILYTIKEIPAAEFFRRLKELNYAEGVITVLSSQKKKKYYLTNLSSFVERFYKFEIEGEIEKGSIIGNFTFSFYLTDNDVRDKILGLLDKFLYYLMFKQRINYEILCKMLDVYYHYSRKIGKYIPIKYAKKFFELDGLEQYYSWAYGVGKEIQKVDARSGKEFVHKIIVTIIKEDLPGLFLKKLTESTYEVRDKLEETTNKNVNIAILEKLVADTTFSKNFYGVKAAILTGLITSLGEKDKKSLLRTIKKRDHTYYQKEM